MKNNGVLATGIVLLTLGWLGTAAVDAAGPVPGSKLLAELAWGGGPGQAGFFNHTSPGFEEPAAMGPLGLARLRAGELVVADTWNDRLLVLDPKGRVERTVSLPELRRPALLAPVSQGGVLVGLFESQRVLRLNSGWELLQAFGGRGEQEGQFLQLTTLLSLLGGKAACGDLGANQVRVADRQGRTVASLDWEGTGLAVDPSGRLVDMSYSDEAGYSVRARALDGAGQTLFPISGRGREGGKLLGSDGKGGWWVRFTRADRPGLLSVRRLDAGGHEPGTALELPHLVSDATVFVQRDGRLLWLEYDAATAPAGTVRIWQTE